MARRKRDTIGKTEGTTAQLALDGSVFGGKRRMLTNKPGVYVIRCLFNGRMYVGSSQNISARCETHKRSLAKGVHRNRYLQNAWNKYGAKAFAFEVLEVCSVEDLLLKEDEYIRALQPQFNLRVVAANNRGVKYSEESRAKITRAMRKRYESKTYRNHMQEKVWSQPKGPHKTHEFKPGALDNIRAAARIAKPLQIEAMRRANTGATRSAEAREKISVGHKGKPGRQWTAEERAKVSASMKAYRARQRELA